MSELPPPPRKSHKTLALIAIGMILAGTFFALPQIETAVNTAISNIHIGGGQQYLNYSVSSPTIKGGGANVTYPPDYAALENYTIGLINHDRYVNGLPPVSASPDGVAQQHANSMLYYGYFSHWDTQGYKPYMRYTLMGGTGAVEENIATQSWSGPHFRSTSDVEASINQLEYRMMYNDSACCQNGHRYNILNGLHNQVSIGVAYSSEAVYLVEDFENQYVVMVISTNSDQVTMSGNFASLPGTIQQVWVLYDQTPAAMTAAQLNGGPESYDPGTSIGGVLPPSSCLLGCSAFSSGITVHATEWKIGSGSLLISFSLSQFVAAHGSGVYNLYLLIGSDSSQTLTTASIFVTEPPSTG